MDHREVGRYWNENAEVWTALARQGYDVYRDYLNTPAFLAMLPDVAGLAGLDIGCGEGYNTREVAKRGAHMTAIDIAETFIAHAARHEEEAPLGVRYQQASAVELPFADASFDFAMATMSLMDMPEQDRAIAEAFRVLKPGGFLQFSISHPCFATPRWQWVCDADGERKALLCGDYFHSEQGDVAEWIFSAAPPEATAGLRKFRVPLFQRPLSWWLNLLLETGFVLERVEEPCASEELAATIPRVADTRIIAYFLHLRCRKPGAR